MVCPPWFDDFFALIFSNLHRYPHDFNETSFGKFVEYGLVFHGYHNPLVEHVACFLKIISNLGLGDMRMK